VREPGKERRRQVEARWERVLDAEYWRQGEREKDS